MKGHTMQVILPDEQVKEIQLLVSNVIKSEIQQFKTDIGLDKPYLNKLQTCQYLDISNNTLDSWIKLGLPVIKIGKTIRFDKNAINSWLQNH
ncbi:helix-turn-helix domain-containing protein [Streptococcus uberis]